MCDRCPSSSWDSLMYVMQGTDVSGYVFISLYLGSLYDRNDSFICIVFPVITRIFDVVSSVFISKAVLPAVLPLIRCACCERLTPLIILRSKDGHLFVENKPYFNLYAMLTAACRSTPRITCVHLRDTCTNPC